jgi:hypothetical protein
MRFACLFALLLCVGVSVNADAPVTVFISEYGTEVDGVAYKSPDEAMQALKKLNPTAVHFVPIQGVSYEDVYAVLDAYRKSGIAAPTGFVGNIRK